VSVIAADAEELGFPSGKDGKRPAAIEGVQAAEAQAVRARRIGAVSDEEIRRAVAKAQETAARRALAKAKQAEQRRLFLALGR